MPDLETYVLPLPPGSPAELGPGWTTLKVRPSDQPGSDLDVINECFILDVYHLRGMQLRPTPPAQLDPRMPDAWSPRIIDLGACTGIFSALALQMFPAARVVALEPNVENYGLLLQNTAKWPARIEARNMAIGDSITTVSMVGDGATGHTEGAYRDPDAPGATAQTTLEQLIAGQMTALLKIDVEGAEYAALDACPVESLALVDRIVMEWHGPEMAPWAHPTGTNVHYGDMLHKLAFTHAVNVYGDPGRGGMLYAHRYDQ